jgi:uncharacterized protein YkwD
MLLLLFAFIGFGFRVSEPKAQPVITDRPLDAEKLWTLIENWRVSQNLSSYKKNSRLCDVATIRVNDPPLDNHKLFLERYQSYPSKIAENLADYAQSEQETLNGWLNSPSHFENLKYQYKYSCIAIKNSYAVQIFSSCENGCPSSLPKFESIEVVSSPIPTIYQSPTITQQTNNQQSYQPIYVPLPTYQSNVIVNNQVVVTSTPKLTVNYYLCSTSMQNWCVLHQNDSTIPLDQYSQKCNAQDNSYWCPNNNGTRNTASNVPGLESLSPNECVCVY